MSPTRRDLFKRAAATVAAASTAALPVLTVTAQPPRLVSVVDTDDPVPYGLAAVKGFMWIHWADHWTPSERTHFLTVIEREFPDLANDVIVHMQGVAKRNACEIGGCTGTVVIQA